MIVTGATGGVGKAFCSLLADKGFNLLITDREISSISELASGIEKQYDKSVETFVCDMTNETVRNDFYQYIKNTDRHYHGLINVAGIDSEGQFSTKDYEKINMIMQLNMISTTENIHKILPYRDPDTPFLIINVSSLAAFQPMPYKAMYSASKRFIVQLTLGIREELKREGVLMSVLCPGGMPTNPLTIQRIEKQGFFGKITTLDTTKVVTITYKKAMSGKAIIIPGFFNKLLFFLTKLIPETVIARMLQKKWSKVLYMRCGSLSPKD